MARKPAGWRHVQAMIDQHREVQTRLRYAASEQVKVGFSTRVKYWGDRKAAAKGLNYVGTVVDALSATSYAAAQALSVRVAQETGVLKADVEISPATLVPVDLEDCVSTLYWGMADLGFEVGYNLMLDRAIALSQSSLAAAGSAGVASVRPKGVERWVFAPASKCCARCQSWAGKQARSDHRPFPHKFCGCMWYPAE